MSESTTDNPEQLSIDIDDADAAKPESAAAIESPGSSDEVEIVEAEPVDEDAPRSNLLSMAQRDLTEEELNEDTDDDLAMAAAEQEDVEAEVVIEAWASSRTQPFTPDQIFRHDEQDGSDDGRSDEEEKDAQEQEHSSSSEIPFDHPADNSDEPVQKERPEHNPQEKEVRSNALGDVLGTTFGGAFGVLSATRDGVRNMLDTRNQKRQELFREQKMNAYHKGLVELDDSISAADGAANALNETSLGKVKKSFKDQGLAPPADVMRDVLRSNPDAQAAFNKVGDALKAVEMKTHNAIKLGMQAGLSGDDLSQTINGRMDKMTDSLEEKLDGFEDTQGNPLTEKLKQLTKRIAEIIAAYVQKVVKALMPSQE